MEDEFISPAVVAKITGLTIPALAQLRYLGRGPVFYKPTPRTVLYKKSEIFDWLERSAHTRTGLTAR